MLSKAPLPYPEIADLLRFSGNKLNFEKTPLG